MAPRLDAQDDVADVGLIEEDPAAKLPGSKPIKKMENVMAFVRTSIRFYFGLIAIVLMIAIGFSMVFLSDQAQDLRLEQFGMVLTAIVLLTVFALLFTFRESWPINIFILYSNIWLCGIIFGIGIFSYVRILIWKLE